MSQGLSNVVVTAFDDEVKIEYQNTGLLRQSVYYKSGMNDAGVFKFPRMSKGLARKHTPQSLVTPMNVTHVHTTATASDYFAGDYTSVFSAAKTNVDERSELAGIIAQAMGRMEDQIVIDECLVAATPLATVGVDVGGSTTGLNPAKFKRTGFHFDNLGVPDTDRFFAAQAKGKEIMLGSVETTSADYLPVQNLINGTLKTFYGFTILWIGARDEGGLPISSTTRDNFAFHKAACGLGVSLAGAVTIDWVPERRSHLTGQDYSAGAIARDGQGIVKVQTTE